MSLLSTNIFAWRSSSSAAGRIDNLLGRLRPAENLAGSIQHTGIQKSIHFLNCKKLARAFWWPERSQPTASSWQFCRPHPCIVSRQEAGNFLLDLGTLRNASSVPCSRSVSGPNLLGNKMAGLLAQRQCIHSQHTCLLRAATPALRVQRPQAARIAAPVQAKAKPADELRALSDKDLDKVVKDGKLQLFYFRSVIAGLKKSRDRVCFAANVQQRLVPPVSCIILTAKTPAKSR